SVQTTDAGSYDLLAENLVGSAVSDPAVLSVNPRHPSITRQPASGDVAEYEPYHLTVTATGYAPLSYQWSRDGKDISGATAAEYLIPEVALEDSATYKVVVSNAFGQAESDPAILRVTREPIFSFSTLAGSAGLGAKVDA